MYQPEDGTDYTPDRLSREFQAIAAALQALLELPNNLVEPPGVQNGTVVYTDATGWNPGGGAGIYARVGGAWVKL